MKILYVTTISLTMNSFFKPHVEMLVREGHHVDIACNYADLALDGWFSELGCTFYQIDFMRSPLSRHNIKAYNQLKKVIDHGDYDIVHCHTPTASVLTRLVCRKYRKKAGLKVFYTAHGFHFYKGAPMLNWLTFYPIEKLCAHFTDKLITINQEDYALAKKKLKAKEVCYVPGVGINLSRFANVHVDRSAKRQEIGVPEDAFLLLSVGELNENKNHQIIIKALAKLNNPNIHYAIAGVGDGREAVLALAEALGVAGQVCFLGYRTDVPELNHTADVFCFPSIREGLPVSLVEAVACGLPVVAAKNRGTCEIVTPDKNGFLCMHDDCESFAQFINELYSDYSLRERISNNATESVKAFDMSNILHIMKEIYQDIRWG